MASFSRKPSTRKPRKVLRIYTEGTKTEPNYFNSIKDELRLSEIDIRVQGVSGFGNHTLPLVEGIIERKNKEKEDGFETEWWVVFDKDNHANFNEAVLLAQKNGINVAYSNECFELWFILHFGYLQTSLGRNNFAAKLTKLLGGKYEKNSSDIYEMIKEKETDAVRNAKNLEKMHDTAGVNSGEKRDPSTLVYKLVERLRALKTERDR
jgi:hypothetical protein